jgi:hypothetical protein
VPTAFTHAVVLASSRQNIEDRAAVFEHGDSLVFLVAAGAGGMAGGAAAADAVVLGVTTALADKLFGIEDGRGPTRTTSALWW